MGEHAGTDERFQYSKLVRQIGYDVGVRPDCVFINDCSVSKTAERGLRSKSSFAARKAFE